jgi:hypothetical protein
MKPAVPYGFCIFGLALIVALGGCGSSEDQITDTDTETERSQETSAADAGQQDSRADTESKSGPGIEDTLDGAALADKHIAANELHLREPPLPYPPWHSRYSQLLKERCQVTITVVDRAPLSSADLEYNEAMKAEIEKRHGPGAIGKCMDDAQKKPAAQAEVLPGGPSSR